jgi:hypothetical protein
MKKCTTQIILILAFLFLNIKKKFLHLYLLILFIPYLFKKSFEKKNEKQLRYLKQTSKYLWDSYNFFLLE